jgi:hypothetical protein
VAATKELNIELITLQPVQLLLKMNDCTSIIDPFTPMPSCTVPDWWITHRKQMIKERRKGFDSLVVLVCWLLWKELNKFSPSGRPNWLQIGSGKLDASG